MITDTTVLMADAKCLAQCIPEGAQKAVLIYLLARVAGVDTTSTTFLKDLLANAKCINGCIPDGMQVPALIYQAAQLV
jgi:hypothetical protein